MITDLRQSPILPGARTSRGRCGSSDREHGFTLLEVLIAVAITAIIGLGVWQVISTVINSRDRVDEVAEKFEAIQKTMLFIERDLGQVVNRRVRDIYGDSRLAFTSREDAYALNLTRQGWRNPIGKRRSELQRVAYEFTGDELHRRYWTMLDRGQDSEGNSSFCSPALKISPCDSWMKMATGRTTGP